MLSAGIRCRGVGAALRLLHHTPSSSGVGDGWLRVTTQVPAHPFFGCDAFSPPPSAWGGGIWLLRAPNLTGRCQSRHLPPPVRLPGQHVHAPPGAACVTAGLGAAQKLPVRKWRCLTTLFSPKIVAKCSSAEPTAAGGAGGGFLGSQQLVSLPS